MATCVGYLFLGGGILYMNPWGQYHLVSYYHTEALDRSYVQLAVLSGSAPNGGLYYVPAHTDGPTHGLVLIII
jgi:hypothetical protein